MSPVAPPSSADTQPPQGLDSFIIQAIQGRLCDDPSSPGLCTWEPLCLGGSDREFYRLRHPNGKSWVVMHYSEAREENNLYSEIAEFLRSIQIQVPKLVFHDASTRWIGLEDLGDVSLHTIFHEATNSQKVDTFYKKALDQAFLLHHQEKSPVKTMPGFDDKLYRWERNYFMEHLVRGWAKMEIPEPLLKEIEEEGEKMAEELSASPRCLIHRDFQSQNLMVHNEKIWLIDFQGMRLGHAAYDLASLLYDPYVALTPAQRSDYLQHYFGNHQGNGSKVLFERHFYQAAAQRLMQALGAYGFLGLVKGKKHFIQHIPRGLQNLSEALNRLDSMPKTLSLVNDLKKLSEASNRL
jgi:aminoglycoside/choline kinase family phosphotransferase